MSSKTILNNRIKRKLKDESGASISYALLLFLVCAALSAVIIAAGTAAAGRLSKMAQTDQRYYAVTSAAELLEEELGDSGLSIVTLSTTTKDESGKDVNDTVKFAKKMNEITDADFEFEDPETTKETVVTPESESTQTQPSTDSDLTPPEDAEQKSLAAAIFAAKKGEVFTLTSNQKLDTDPLAVRITIEEKSDASALIAVEDMNGAGEGSGHFKVYLKYEVHTQKGKPPVTKLADGTQIIDGEEITWDLVKMMTSYDK